MEREWGNGESCEGLLSTNFFDNKSYWHHTNWYLQPAGTNIAVFSTLLPLPFAQNKREEEYSLYVLRYKSICPNSKAAGLVQCAAPQQDAMSWLLLLLTLPQRFSSFFAFHFALTRHLNIYKQMIFFEGHIRQKFIFLSYNFFVLKVDGDTCILFEELKWIRCGKTIRTGKGDTSLCCLSAK